VQYLIMQTLGKRCAACTTRLLRLHFPLLKRKCDNRTLHAAIIALHAITSTCRVCSTDVQLARASYH
jgi:hypothetical protein